MHCLHIWGAFFSEFDARSVGLLVRRCPASQDGLTFTMFRRTNEDLVFWQKDLASTVWVINRGAARNNNKIHQEYTLEWGTLNSNLNVPPSTPLHKEQSPD